jgi:allantoin racemase
VSAADTRDGDDGDDGDGEEHPPLRIWYQGFLDLSTVPAYEPSLRRHAAAILRPGTEVAIHGMPPGSFQGTSPAEVARHAYTSALHTQRLIDNARRAEAEGYDTFAIGIVQNPGLREMRTLVDIPVAGYGESAMHLACLLGRRFSVLAFNRDLLDLLDEQIDGYGLRSRAAPTTLIETEYEVVARGFEDPAPLLTAFEAAARRALDAGADVLIPGQMVLAEILWQQGVRRVEGAPVVDALAAALKSAELLAELRRDSGVWHTRRGFWGVRPPNALVESTRARYLRDP